LQFLIASLFYWVFLYLSIVFHSRSIQLHWLI
jgi:hypothetical protein